MYTINSPKCTFKEICVEDHDGDIIYWTGSRTTAVSCMRNEKYAI